MKEIVITNPNGITLHTKKSLVEDDIKIKLDDSIFESVGKPIELATNEEMEAVLVADNIGKIYKYVGETNETFTNGNLYQVMEVE